MCWKDAEDEEDDEDVEDDKDYSVYPSLPPLTYPFASSEFARRGGFIIPPTSFIGTGSAMLGSWGIPTFVVTASCSPVYSSCPRFACEGWMRVARRVAGVDASWRVDGGTTRG